MTTQEIKTLREKLNTIPDDVLEKVAELLMPVVVSNDPEQYIIDARLEDGKEQAISGESIKFKNKIYKLKPNWGNDYYNYGFYAGFKAAEKYHGIIK